MMSPELQVVDSVLNAHGLYLYTAGGYQKNKVYLGTSLTEACWGRHGGTHQLWPQGNPAPPPPPLPPPPAPLSLPSPPTPFPVRDTLPVPDMFGTG